MQDCCEICDIVLELMQSRTIGDIGAGNVSNNIRFGLIWLVMSIDITYLNEHEIGNVCADRVLTFSNIRQPFKYIGLPSFFCLSCCCTDNAASSNLATV